MRRFFQKMQRYFIFRNKNKKENAPKLSRHAQNRFHHKRNITIFAAVKEAISINY